MKRLTEIKHRNFTRRLALVASVVTLGIGLAPASVASAANGDPLAAAAASALTFLKVPAPRKSKAAPGSVAATVSSVTPSTLPPPPATSAPVTSPVVVPPTSWSNSYIIGSIGSPEVASRGFALSAPVTTSPVRLLPTESTTPNTTVPQTVIQAAKTTVKTTKATKVTKATSLVPVGVDGATVEPQSDAVAVGSGTGSTGSGSTGSGSAVAQESSAQTPAPVFGSFEAARLSVAQLVASRHGKTNAATLDSIWANSDPRRMVAVLTALSQVGTLYRYSGNEPGGFDCSGLTSYSWNAAGVKLPRTSSDQINAAASRSSDQLLPGDLVWRPGHIMMYVGIGDVVVDSPQTGKRVTVRSWGRTSRYGSPV